VELWRRRPTAAQPGTFDHEFISMARALSEGPSALAPLFQRIGPWHLLDPTFSYQGRVGAQARARLQHHPTDRDALWSLALIAVLQNRASQADQWFAKLEQLDGRGSWASAYRGAVLLADWNSCGAARVSDVSPPAATPDAAGAAAVLLSLRDLGRSLCFDPRGPIGLSRSLPQAIGRLKSL
jgi:hypothetical protein